MDMPADSPCMVTIEAGECALRHLPAVFRSARFADVTVVADDVQIKAHKVILASASQVLAKHLDDSDELDLDKLIGRASKQRLARTVLNFMYSGECHVEEPSQLVGLYEVACRLQMPTLARAAELSLSHGRLDAPSCLLALAAANQHGSEVLAQAAEEYLTAHFAEVVSTEGFLGLDDNVLLGSVVASGRLNVPSEAFLLDTLLEWTLYRPFERIVQLQTMLCHGVRFGLVPAAHLRTALVDHPLVLKCDGLRAIVQAHLYHHEGLINGTVPADQLWRLRREPSAALGFDLVVVGAGHARTFDSQSGRWADMPKPCEPRSCLAAVSTPDKGLVVVGGDNQGRCLNTAERYFPATRSWTRLPYMSTPRSAAAAVVHEGMVVAIGGFDGVNDTNLVEQLPIDPADDPPAMPFRPSPPSSPLMGGCSSSSSASSSGASIPGSPTRSMLSVDTRFSTSSDASSSASCYNPSEQWTGLPSLAHARHGLGAAVLDGLVYAVGGVSSARGGTPLATVEVLDPSCTTTTQSWAACPPLPTPRGGLVVVALSGFLYAIGGHGPASPPKPASANPLWWLDNAATSADVDMPLRTVERYDPTTRRWERVANMTCARSFASGTVVGGRLVVSGGVDEQGRAMATCECYDPVEDAWTVLPAVTFPGPTSEHALVAVRARQ